MLIALFICTLAIISGATMQLRVTSDSDTLLTFHLPSHSLEADLETALANVPPSIPTGPSSQHLKPARRDSSATANPDKSMARNPTRMPHRRPQMEERVNTPTNAIAAATGLSPIRVPEVSPPPVDLSTTARHQTLLHLAIALEHDP